MQPHKCQSLSGSCAAFRSIDPPNLGYFHLDRCCSRWASSKPSEACCLLICPAQPTNLLLQVLFTLGQTPRWASYKPNEPSVYGPGRGSPPKSISDWSAFVAAMARRYRGRIHAYEARCCAEAAVLAFRAAAPGMCMIWQRESLAQVNAVSLESQAMATNWLDGARTLTGVCSPTHPSKQVWNEPDIQGPEGFYNGSPESLAALEAATAAALAQEDPKALLLTPPMSGGNGATQLGWLGRYLKAGGGKHAQAVAWHAYVSAPEAGLNGIEAVRQVGASLPILCIYVLCS